MKYLVLFALLSFSYANAAIITRNVMGGDRVEMKCRNIGRSYCMWVTPSQEYVVDTKPDEGYDIHYDGKKDCTLIIHKVKLKDDGLWSCVVSGSTGDQTYLNITVAPKPPEIRFDGQPLNGDMDDWIPPEIQVTCVSEGGKPAPNITWQLDHGLISSGYDDVPVLQSDKSFKVESKKIFYAGYPGRHTSNRAHTISTKYEKLVRCIVNHPAYKKPYVLERLFSKKYATYEVRLTRNGAPVAETVDIEVGEPLECEANGNPRPRDDDFKFYKFDGNLEVLVHAGPRFAIGEPGRYACRGGNNLSGLLSSRISTVQIVTDVKRVTHSGERYTIPCIVQNGAQQCFWNHDRGTIVISERPQFSPGYEVIGNPLKGNCTLLIESIKYGDDGNWGCDVIGNPKRMFKLTVT